MNKKFIRRFFTAILCLAFAVPAMAQRDIPFHGSCPPGTIQTGQTNSIPPRPICEPRVSSRDDVKAKREELNTKIKDEREAAKKRLETAREEAKKADETRRSELKDKISKLRDEKKKQIATRLNEQLEHLSTQWTDHFSNVLNRLSEILSKVELRADKAQAAGKDVSAVRTAIANAKTMIGIARTAVETQAKKTYTATFSSDKELNTAFKNVKEQLRKDLFGLRDVTMKSAREAVQSAHQALKGIPHVDDEPKATTTPSK